jgi:hypothetical protein
MKMVELLDTPIGALAAASVRNYPELETLTPVISKKLKAFADENDMPLEYLICAVLNWCATRCEDMQPFMGLPDDPPSDTIN